MSITQVSGGNGVGSQTEVSDPHILEMVEGHSTSPSHPVSHSSLQSSRLFSPTFFCPTPFPLLSLDSFLSFLCLRFSVSLFLSILFSVYSTFWLDLGSL